MIISENLDFSSLTSISKVGDSTRLIYHKTRSSTSTSQIHVPCQSPKLCSLVRIVLQTSDDRKSALSLEDSVLLNNVSLRDVVLGKLFYSHKQSTPIYQMHHTQGQR